MFSCILLNSVYINQFEASDDPLEKVTTAEAIRALTDYYRTSQYCYAANEKVEEMSKVVSGLECNVNYLIFCVGFVLIKHLC